MRATLRVKMMQILAYRHAWYQQVMLLSARDLVGTTVKGIKSRPQASLKEDTHPSVPGN